MKKVLFGIMIVGLLCACGKSVEVQKKTVVSAPVVKEDKKDAVKTVFSKDVEDLTAEIGIEKVKLKWKLGDTAGVDKIEILTKQSLGKVYKPVKSVALTESEIEIPLYSFIEFDVKVRLIAKDGAESKGVVLEKIATKMKNVIMDKFEGREMQI